LGDDKWCCKSEGSKSVCDLEQRACRKHVPFTGYGVKGLEVRIFLLDFSLGSFGFWKRGNNNVHLVKDATISLKLTTEALGLLGIQRRSLLERERYRKIPRRDN